MNGEYASLEECSIYYFGSSQLCSKIDSERFRTILTVGSIRIDHVFGQNRTCSNKIEQHRTLSITTIIIEHEKKYFWTIKIAHFNFFIDDPNRTCSNRIERNWTESNNIEQYWTISNNIEQYWTILNNIEQYWTISNNIEHYRTIQNNIEQYWT